MSMFYTTAEQPLRLEIYYCTNGIATMFGGLIGYAVGHINSSLQKWMWVFLFFGAASIIMSGFSFFFLPDSPATAPFLDERERGVAVKRVTMNRGGVKNSHFKKYQAVQTVKDPKTWILFIMVHTYLTPPRASIVIVQAIYISSRPFNCKLMFVI